MNSKIDIYAELNGNFHRPSIQINQESSLVIKLKELIEFKLKAVSTRKLNEQKSS